jgi:hypothetical protein
MEEKLRQAIAEAKAQYARWTAEYERLNELEDGAADAAYDKADEWDSWLSELEGQLEAILTDTQDVLSRRPKVA